MAKGASLYICPHPDYGATPYIGNLPGCGSHLCHVHYGTCLLCLFCPDRRYYPVSGWKDHMNSKHHHVPWYGASKELQAKLALSALTAPASADVVVTQLEIPMHLLLPPQILLPPQCLPLPMPEPVKEEPPLEDTLVYEEDVDPSSSAVSPEMEQLLLDPPPEEEIEKPRPPTPVAQ